MKILIPLAIQKQINWPCGVAVNILAFGARDSGSNPLRAVEEILFLKF